MLKHSSIPDGWVFGILSDFADINPRLPNKAELLDDTKVSFIKMEDVSNNAVITNKRIRNYSEVSKGFTSFKNQDVLVAKITPCFENGKGGFADNLYNGVGFGSTEFHVIRSNEKLCSKYLYQFTNYSSFRLEAASNMTGSAGQRRVQTDFFKTYRMGFPPLPEQQKIAAILSSVDDVIEKTQSQIDKLKDLKAGMMQELLSPSEGSRQSKVMGHAEFKDSPLGRIPVGWDVLTIDDFVTKVGSGVTPKGGGKAYVDKGIPLIRSQNVYPDGLRLSDVCYITNEQHDKMANSKLKPNDVLLNITGASIGRCYYLPDDFTEGNVNQHVCIIRLKKSLVNHVFLSLILNSQFGQSQIMSLQAGGNREGLNFQQIRAIKLAIPTLKEQEMIAASVSSVDNKISVLRGKLKSTQNTKKALMQDLLTGKVRVQPD